MSSNEREEIGHVATSSKRSRTGSEGLSPLSELGREREGVIRRRTRRVGEFEFRVVLPNEVNSEGVDAKLNDGVLTVRIPKAERAQRRRIEVKSA